MCLPPLLLHFCSPFLFDSQQDTVTKASTNKCLHLILIPQQMPTTFGCRCRRLICSSPISHTCIIRPSFLMRSLPSLVHGAGSSSSRFSRYLQTRKPDFPFSGQYFTTWREAEIQDFTLKTPHQSSADGWHQFSLPVIPCRFHRIDFLPQERIYCASGPCSCEQPWLVCHLSSSLPLLQLCHWRERCSWEPVHYENTFTCIS